MKQHKQLIAYFSGGHRAENSLIHRHFITDVVP